MTVAGNIPGTTQTLPLAIYSHVQLRNDAEAMRLISVSIALAVATLIVHNWLLSRGSRRRSSRFGDKATPGRGAP